MASPPRTRARSSSAQEVDSIIEAVVARLTDAGLLGAAAAPRSVPAEEEEKPVVTLDDQVGPARAQQRVWIEELRCQHVTSPRFGPREKEVRALLIIADGGGPTSDHHSRFWGRVQQMLIVAHHGWAAAIQDTQHADMDRLGIHLAAPAAVQPAAGPCHPVHAR